MAVLNAFDAAAARGACDKFHRKFTARFPTSCGLPAHKTPLFVTVIVPRTHSIPFVALQVPRRVNPWSRVFQCSAADSRTPATSTASVRMHSDTFTSMQQAYGSGVHSVCCGLAQRQDRFPNAWQAAVILQAGSAVPECKNARLLCISGGVTRLCKFCARAGPFHDISPLSISYSHCVRAWPALIGRAVRSAIEIADGPGENSRGRVWCA